MAFDRTRPSAQCGVKTVQADPLPPRAITSLRQSGRSGGRASPGSRASRVNLDAIPDLYKFVEGW